MGSAVPGAPTTLRAVFANVAPASLAEARAKAQALTSSLSYNLAAYSDAETATAQLRANTNQRLALLVAVGLVMGAIAVMSLMNAVVSSVNERRKELALLRAVGSTPAQVRNLILLEAGLLGLVGGIVGIAGGTVLGTGALVGLEMRLGNIELPWGLMGACLVVSLLLSLVAGLLPAKQFLRISPAEAMRLE
jgi:putative ABC transport system permease protein